MISTLKHYESDSKEINNALLHRPAEFRKNFLVTRLPVGQRLAVEQAWPVFRKYLDALEEEMATILRDHSVFFWLHLYRRTGIALSPGHEIGSADERTITLVRRTVELAIFKHGSLPKTPDDIERSDQVPADRTLTAERQPSISLWSGGPRFLFIPFGLGDVLDLHALPSLLSNLFVGLTYDTQTKGPAFEEVFRSALKYRQFKVETGIKKAPDGSSRQIDAGVIIADELFLFECVSIGRPLDYEIGQPSTILERNRRLEKKVAQALTLAEFFRSNLVGTNFDFRHIRRFELHPVRLTPA